MGEIVRYMLVLNAAIVTAAVLCDATLRRAEHFTFAANLSPSESQDIVLTTLAVLALIAISVLAHYILRVFPAMIRSWFARYKTRLATYAAGLFICAVFVVA